jgi:hypothetical protein
MLAADQVTNDQLAPLQRPLKGLTRRDDFHDVTRSENEIKAPISRTYPLVHNHV